MLLLIWILGFLALNLYANGLPKLFQLDVMPWLAYVAGFFIVAHFIARYVLKLKGLVSFGLQRHKGWPKLLLLGFLIGFVVWVLKYLVFYWLGKFEVAGWMDGGYIAGMLAQALLGMLLAAAINDVLIRGYWLAYCQKANLMTWYLVITTVLYALDDSWNEGINGVNLVFSAVLGISLAYTVLKTGSIWMAIGIHWGSNMMFRVMAGFNGQGVWQLEQVKEGITYEWISILITALIFPLVYLLLRNRKTDLARQEKRNYQGKDF